MGVSEASRCQVVFEKARCLFFFNPWMFCFGGFFHGKAKLVQREELAVALSRNIARQTRCGRDLCAFTNAIGFAGGRRLFALRLCCRRAETEAMKEAGGAGKKRRRGWGSLSGHHVDLIDHSGTCPVCAHTHTHRTT